MGRRGTNFGVLRSALIEDAGEDGLVDGQERSLLKGLLVRLTCRSTAEIMIRRRRRPRPESPALAAAAGTLQGHEQRLVPPFALRPCWKAHLQGRERLAGRRRREGHLLPSTPRKRKRKCKRKRTRKRSSGIGRRSVAVVVVVVRCGDGGKTPETAAVTAAAVAVAAAAWAWALSRAASVLRSPVATAVTLSNCWVLDVAIRQVGSPISASLSPHLLPEEPGVRWTSPTGGWVELPVRTSPPRREREEPSKSIKT